MFGFCLVKQVMDRINLIDSLQRVLVTSLDGDGLFLDGERIANAILGQNVVVEDARIDLGALQSIVASQFLEASCPLVEPYEKPALLNLIGQSDLC